MSGSPERVVIPAELHALATAPALPGTPAVLYEGEAAKVIGGARERRYTLVPPQGGHALLDLYFCAFASEAFGITGPNESDDGLDELTRLAWRMAVSAVRTRPYTGPVPAGLPKELK